MKHYHVIWVGDITFLGQNNARCVAMWFVMLGGGAKESVLIEHQHSHRSRDLKNMTKY